MAGSATNDKLDGSDTLVCTRPRSGRRVADVKPLAVRRARTDLARPRHSVLAASGASGSRFVLRPGFGRGTAIRSRARSRDARRPLNHFLAVQYDLGTRGRIEG